MPPKTSNVLRYAVTLGNNFIIHVTTALCKFAVMLASLFEYLLCKITLLLLMLFCHVLSYLL